MNDDPRVIALQNKFSKAFPKERSEFTSIEMELIEDERAFDQAFGKWLDFGKRDRTALIRLKREFDLTYKRIKTFARAGLVFSKEDKIAIKGAGVSAAIGLFMWSWLLPIGMFALFGFPNLLENWGALKTVTFGLGSWMALFATGVYFIRPWVLEKQTLKSHGLAWNAKIEGPR